MEIIGKIVIGFVIDMLATLLNAWVLMLLWLLVPMYGIEAITQGEAFALLVIIGFISPKTKPDPDAEWLYVVYEAVVMTVSLAGFYLLMGYIARAYI